MENKPNKPKTAKKAFLNRVILSLSPCNDYDKRSLRLPKLNNYIKEPKSSKSFKTSPGDGNYSIYYIGENLGTFGITSKKSVIPRLTREEISKEKKVKNGISNNSSFFIEHTINNYFRPKALTPSSVKMYDFKDIKVKMSKISNSVRKIKSNKLFSID